MTMGQMNIRDLKSKIPHRWKWNWIPFSSSTFHPGNNATKRKETRASKNTCHWATHIVPSYAWVLLTRRLAQLLGNLEAPTTASNWLPSLLPISVSSHPTLQLHSRLLLVFPALALGTLFLHLLLRLQHSQPCPQHFHKKRKENKKTYLQLDLTMSTERKYLAFYNC